VWVGVLQSIELIPNGIVSVLAFPANQKLDVGSVVLWLRTAVKDFSRFGLEDTCYIDWRKLRQSRRSKA
jgi:hypothetical protein